MGVVIEQSAAGSTVRLNDDVCIGAARELKIALTEALASDAEVEIDVAALTSLDITTLQLLWAAQCAAIKTGTRLNLSGPIPEAMEQATDLAGLEMPRVTQQ